MCVRDWIVHVEEFIGKSPGKNVRDAHFALARFFRLSHNTD